MLLLLLGLQKLILEWLYICFGTLVLLSRAH